MIGRMSTDQIHMSSLDVILDAQARLQRTQEELATGKRFLSPSDDPVAAAQIVEIRSDLARMETYQRNLDSAFSQLAYTESKIASAEESIIRIKTLLLQAANATYSVSDRQAMALEMTAMRDHMLSLANSQDANGDFTFAGSAVTEAPYQRQEGEITYQGDQIARAMNVARGLTVSPKLTGDEVFGNADPSNVDVFSVLDAAITAVENNDQAAINSAISAVDEGAEQIFQSRSEIGVRMNRVDDQKSLNDSAILSFNKSLSGLEDLDYAKAVSELSSRMLALESAQKAYAKMQGISLFNYL